MAFPKMMMTGCGRSSLIMALLLAVLGIKAAGCENLKITYPRGSFTLKGGDLLNLTCTVTYEESSEVEVHWCKWMENQSNCVRVVKELERLQFNPQEAVNLLEIHNVSYSHSGRYQCSATEGNQTAMGHYISVTVTGSSVAMSRDNNDQRMDSWLNKMQILIMILWLIFC